ncbi:MAG: DUF3027 domain-containing protein [Actinobacteria bacterium]|jgi:hypothetical protein|nr:DUF3027 domain-containing protein [Actinomycetota bacterium]NCU89083.1 DUF3027 domain-containing protein [Actinomycetota bacterium]NCX25664.1 DUF3027 domain-containing protein [Burkholderiaceae bacterium]
MARTAKKNSKALRVDDPFKASEIARAAALEDAKNEKFVGSQVSVESDDDHVATYLFEALLPGYVGWRWAVTVAKLDSESNPTICDVVLLPGTDALLAPEWIPYSDRITAEDVGVGTIVPTAADDVRLVPASAVLPADEELDLHELFELGAGRLRVLSIEGRDQAAKRWIEGDRGPNAPIAQYAPKNCGSCGFYLPIAGSFRQAFGVCANAISPEDARVVSVNHGCGAHSEAIN